MEQPFTRREIILLPAVIVVVLLSRLPWISVDYEMDYGLDEDGYRVVNIARAMAQHGYTYFSSRSMGFPVHEYLVALTPAKTSAIFSNGMTTVFSCIATLFFALILRHFRIRQYLLLTLAFAMTPAVYISSVTTIDFMFALAFMLGGTYFILNSRLVIAGIFLGLAIGCRITSGAILLPLVLWMLMDRVPPPPPPARPPSPYGRIALFGFTTLVVGALCYSPSIARSGLDWLTIATSLFDHYPPIKHIINLGVVQVWGLLGSVGILGLFLLLPFSSQSMQRIRKALTQPRTRHGLVLAFTTVALYVITFLYLPGKSGYLIPIVPFVLLLFALSMPAKYVGYFATILLLSPFLLFWNGDKLCLHGPIMQEHIYRIQSKQMFESLSEKVAGLPANAVIVAGYHWPVFKVKLAGKYKKEQLVDILGEADYRRYTEQGRPVYFILEATNQYNRFVSNADLEQLGARPLLEYNLSRQPRASYCLAV